MEDPEPTAASPDTQEKPAPDMLELLTKLNAKVDALLMEKKMENSPWIRGDQGAAEYAGYRSKKAFLAWAREHRIKPFQEKGLNFWDRMAIVKARNKQQRY